MGRTLSGSERVGYGVRVAGICGMGLKIPERNSPSPGPPSYHGRSVEPTNAKRWRRKRVKVLSVRESELWVMPAADRHWLPSMERWLPGSWACTPIADKAVKEDGADINFAP